MTLSIGEPMPSYRRFRATYNGQYLFHCVGKDPEDALDEARRIAARTMHERVVSGLTVNPD